MFLGAWRRQITFILGLIPEFRQMMLFRDLHGMSECLPHDNNPSLIV